MNATAQVTAGAARAQARSRGPLIAVGLALVLVAGYAGQRWHAAHAPYEWNGTVEAHTASLGSRAGGRVKQVLAVEGERVQRDQTLVTLEPGDWPAQLLQAQAEQAQAQATLDKLRAGARPEEIAAAQARSETAQAALSEAVAGARREEIAQAQARLRAQEVAVDQARLTAERLHKLDAAGAAVPADLDNAESALKSAIASRDAAQSALAELESGSRREQIAQARGRAAEQEASAKLISAGTRPEDLLVAQAQLQAAEGRVQQVSTMIDELAIKAPAVGRIEALDLRPGDILLPNATAVTLVEDDQLFVRIYVPETMLGHVAVGQKVAITVDSFPHESFPGVVQSISHTGEYSPRNLQTADERADQVFATRVGILAGADRLRAGMAASIQVPRGG
jgi:multidrug resistance efflux pump